MSKSGIFDIFSRRSKTSFLPAKPLTDGFRNRTLMLCRDTFSPKGMYSGQGSQFWAHIVSRLQYQRGSLRLSDSQGVSPVEDTVRFLLKCEDEHYLDFVETIFRFPRFPVEREEELVDAINEFFLVDDLPYSLTNFAYRGGRRVDYRGDRDDNMVIAYPQVIRRESQAEYITAIEPTLSLLMEEGFAAANLEYRAALEDYRKGDFADCLVKCASSLESVMKVVCHRNRWSYQENDTASTLFATVQKHTGLPPYLKDPILVVATLRNRMSTAHGAGTQPREVPQHLARYSLCATAGAVLLLVGQESS